MSSNWGDVNISENFLLFFQFLINHCKKLFQLQFANIHLLRLTLFTLPIYCFLQVKGKAAIDVVCNPLGKSGGALIQQFMILTFGSLANSTPYLGGILLVIVLAWLGAAKSLDTQFTALRQEEELEKEMERAAVKIPVVAENVTGNGSLASGSALNPMTDDSTSSSSETSAPRNI